MDATPYATPNCLSVQSTSMSGSQGVYSPTASLGTQDVSQLLLEHVTGIKAGLQTTLSDLHTIKNAQKTLGDRVGSLEGVLGVSRKKRPAPSRRRKAKGKGLAQVDQLDQVAASSEPPVPNFLDRLAAIEFAVEELLERTEDRHSIKVVLRDTATSPAPETPPPNYTIEHNAHSSSPESSSRLAEVSIKQYADASVDAYIPAATSPACSDLSCNNQSHFTFVPVDWSSEGAILRHFAGSPVSPTNSNDSPAGLPTPQLQVLNMAGSRKSPLDDVVCSPIAATPLLSPPSIPPLEPSLSNSSSTLVPSLVSPPFSAISPDKSAAQVNQRYGSETPPTLAPHELQPQAEETTPAIKAVPMSQDFPVFVPDTVAHPAAETVDIDVISHSPTHGASAVVSPSDDSPMHGVQGKAFADGGPRSRCLVALPCSSSITQDPVNTQSHPAAPSSLTFPSGTPSIAAVCLQGVTSSSPSLVLEWPSIEGNRPVGALTSRLIQASPWPLRPDHPHVSVESVGGESSDQALWTKKTPQISQSPSVIGTPPPSMVPLSAPTQARTQEDGGAVENDPKGHVEHGRGSEVGLEDRSNGICVQTSGPADSDLTNSTISTSLDDELRETGQPTVEITINDHCTPNNLSGKLPPSELMNANEGNFPTVLTDIQSPCFMINDTHEVTPAEALSQNTEDEGDIANALLLGTPVSIPSLLLPSTTVSRSSPAVSQQDVIMDPTQTSQAQVQRTPPGDLFASDSIQSIISWSMDWSAILTNPPPPVPTVNLPSPDVPLPTESLSPLTSVTSEKGLSKAEASNDDRPLSSYVTTPGSHPVKPKNVIDKESRRYHSESLLDSISSEGGRGRAIPGRSVWVSRRGGPSASLPELTLLARREGSSTLRERKRKRDAVGSARTDKAGENTGAELRPVGSWESSEVIHSPDVYGASGAIAEANPGINRSVSLTAAEANLIEAKGQTISLLSAPPTTQPSTEPFQSAQSGICAAESTTTSRLPLRIVIPGGKRVKREKSVVSFPNNTLESPKEDKRPSKRRKSDRVSEKTRTRYVLLDGQVVRINAEPSQSDRSAEQTSHSVLTEHRSFHASGRNETLGSTLGATKRRGGKPVDLLMTSPSIDLPDMPSHQRRVILPTWPKLMSSPEKWRRQFIQCDNCGMWYHYGCVGVVEGDSRLDQKSAFVCPLCCVQTATRQTLRNRESCNRPDCPEVVEENDGLYFVERLVGRKTVGLAGFLWLAKWEGYPMNQATWIPEGNILGDDSLIKQFEDDALKQGIDLRADAILMSDAVAAGCDYPASQP